MGALKKSGNGLNYYLGSGQVGHFRESFIDTYDNLMNRIRDTCDEEYCTLKISGGNTFYKNKYLKYKKKYIDAKRK